MAVRVPADVKEIELRYREPSFVWGAWALALWCALLAGTVAYARKRGTPP
jgi:hypothetical protein